MRKGKLGLVVKLDIVNADRVAFFNAHLFQSVKKAALAELAIKIHPGFIVIKIDIGNEPFQPWAGDQPETVLGLDGDILNTAGLGQGCFFAS